MTKKIPPYQKYWLQINKAHKELTWMSYDPDIEYTSDLKKAISILKEIKTHLNEKIKK